MGGGEALGRRSSDRDVVGESTPELPRGDAEGFASPLFAGFGRPGTSALAGRSAVGRAYAGCVRGCPRPDIAQSVCAHQGHAVGHGGGQGGGRWRRWGGTERVSASGEGCGGERVERRHVADVLGKGIWRDGTDGGFGEREDPQESRAQQTIVARGLREDVSPPDRQAAKQERRRAE